LRGYTNPETVKRFRGGLAFKAHRLLRVMKKKRKLVYPGLLCMMLGLFWYPACSYLRRALGFRVWGLGFRVQGLGLRV